MKRLGQRVLVLSNSGDPIHNLAERARDEHPEWDYAEMEGGTFDIIDERPEEWSAVVASWLQGGA